LSISITFEQNYGGIDGDSASSTELYAILSSLSDIPIRQGIAVTGSVNQKGQIQAIGDVNQKIEGFFEVCNEKGLTGKQGVIIPKANVDNLMIKREVINAVKHKKFHIYQVSTVEEGIEILTGVASGKPDKNGNFPAGTVYGAVQQKLKTYFERSLKQKDK
jgi:predicted ATP-dependent protease